MHDTSQNDSVWSVKNDFSSYIYILQLWSVLVCSCMESSWYQITSPIYSSGWTELKFLTCLLCLLFHVTLSSIIFLKFVPMINLFHISARAVIFILSSCGHSAHVGGMGYSGPVIVALRVFFIYSNLSFIRNT